jgi:hypothetical protein
LAFGLLTEISEKGLKSDDKGVALFILFPILACGLWRMTRFVRYHLMKKTVYTLLSTRDNPQLHQEANPVQHKSDPEE